jgi:hypothetical protein
MNWRDIYPDPGREGNVQFAHGKSSSGGQVSVLALDLAFHLQPSPLARLGVWAGGSKTNDGEIKMTIKSKN